jgi:hypothetical protein
MFAVNQSANNTKNQGDNSVPREASAQHFFDESSDLTVTHPLVIDQVRRAVAFSFGLLPDDIEIKQSEPGVYTVSGLGGSELIAPIAKPKPNSGKLDPASQTGDFVFPADPDQPHEILDRLDRDFNSIFTGGLTVDVLLDVLDELSDLMAEYDTLGRAAAAAQFLSEAADALNDATLDDANGAYRHVTDISNEESRIYFYVGGDGEDDTEIEVDCPITLSFAGDGAHQITCDDGTGQIVPPGWFSITIYPKEGEACFPGHPAPGNAAA